jgi:flagellin
MRIATNLEALYAHRWAARAAQSQATATGRVSSGYRINRAADDAAGLAISESMRGQSGGLGQASRNAQDAVSLLQTAEGALSTVSSLLQRVRDLAVQYHNGTLSPEDRQATQAEAWRLGEEVIQIADRTEFNGVPVFGRSETTRSFQVGADDGDTIDLAMPSLRDLLSIGGISNGQRQYQYVAQPVDTTIDMVSTGPGPDGVTPVSTNHSYTVPANATIQQVQAIVNGDPNGPVGVYINTDSGAAYQLGFITKGMGPSYSVVATGASIQLYSVSPGHEQSAPFIDHDISEIDAAVTAIAVGRAKFGAAQNRLEHRLQNLLSYQENLSTAESRIRDADIAHEFAGMTKASILMQASTTMLTQANQAPRQVLSLLNT